MDMGAQQDAPDTGADASGTRTADNAGASNKSTEIDKGKAPEVPEVQAEPEQTASGHTTPAAPDKIAPQTSVPEKTSTLAPAKTPAKSPALAPGKAAPTPPAQAKPTTTKITKIITKEKSATPPASTAMTLHVGKGAARISSLINPELEGRAPLKTKSGNSLGSLK
jgi:hypothetical protein